MSAYIPVELQRKIRTSFADCCAYCRTAEVLTATTFEVEHILPRKAGGETVLENLCLACPSCNRYKADRQSFVDPVTEQAVPLFHPRTQVYKDHPSVYGWYHYDEPEVPLTPLAPDLLKKVYKAIPSHEACVDIRYNS